ncbi:hypothetical protein [Streptomyces bikiniensis]|nr:hypothetical protein [Streptomyces bikiniensis]
MTLVFAAPVTKVTCTVGGDDAVRDVLAGRSRRTGRTSCSAW